MTTPTGTLGHANSSDTEPAWAGVQTPVYMPPPASVSVTGVSPVVKDTCTVAPVTGTPVELRMEACKASGTPVVATKSPAGSIACSVFDDAVAGGTISVTGTIRDGFIDLENGLALGRIARQSQEEGNQRPLVSAVMGSAGPNRRR